VRRCYEVELLRDREAGRNVLLSSLLHASTVLIIIAIAANTATLAAIIAAFIAIATFSVLAVHTDFTVLATNVAVGTADFITLKTQRVSSKRAELAAIIW
jgi:hypothetical protein